ncbi:nucleotidyltransferase family protein [Flavonifractor sp. An306]|uniref:nucleotidyltransferase family protein n=1 Tax=Flavonifractor sp. An306 TaxID=1965629 RepID=UPI000B3877A7|nr:nucleotidyltransferase family protein [Flavonifractor sp. An306]OUO34618.1 hypothetical protein B5F88_15700 [Flavonifractor sp. An306]
MRILVLAAGKGSRLRPYTDTTNKCMIPIAGKPLLHHNLLQCLQAGPIISEIIFVVGYRREQIQNYFGAEFQGVRIRYIHQESLDGIAGAVALATPALQGEPFLMTLGDELLWEPDLAGMVANFFETGVDGLCGVLHGMPSREIRKNYSVRLTRDGFIDRFAEKPSIPFNDLMGLGYCVLQPSTLPYAIETPVNPKRQQRELCDWLALCIQHGLHLRPFQAGQEVINLNSAQSLELLKTRFSGVKEDQV